MKRWSIIRCRISTLLLATIYNRQQNIYKKYGTTLVWVPLTIEHLNAITDCKFGRHDTEHYNK